MSKKRADPKVIGLSVTVGLLAIALIVFIVLFATKETSTPPAPGACTSPDCTVSAARILENMDPSADPCKDFYKYACGGWLKKNIIPETSSRYGVFDILRDELEVVLKAVLEKSDDAARDAYKKSRTLYASCIDQEKIEALNSQPLLQLLGNVNEWPIATVNWNTTQGPTWIFEKNLANLAKKYRVRPIVNTYVGIDDKNSTAYIINIDQPGFGLPSRDYYFSETESYVKAREAYKDFIVAIANIVRRDKAIPDDDVFVREQMEGLFNFEKKLAEASTPDENRTDITLIYHKMSLSELSTNYSIGNFSWLTYMKDIFIDIKDISSAENIVVYAPEYLIKLKTILEDETPSTIQNYIVWMLTVEHVESLSQKFKDARAEFRKALYGTTSDKARWRSCSSYVNNILSNAVGALYVEEAFAGDSKKVVQELVKWIREVFISNLDKITWMDDATKGRARDKAFAIVERIGYPEFIVDKNDPKIDEEYADLAYSTTEYFANTLASLAFDSKRRLARINTAVDKNEWISGAAVVNAFYSSSYNQIVFPAGILQPPFFGLDQAMSLNFGGIGMVIGHEIIHGFDDSGRNFDKDGNLVDWWSAESAKNFKQKSQCIIDQYGNFQWDLAGGQNLSGINTLGENIADNGGIRQAYEAYMAWVKDNGEELPLPGLHLSHQQLFFLNFAQVWCGDYRPEYASNSIKTDVHSPGKFRVIGSLQNFEKFSEAYQCKASDAMNPRSKCHVW
ncbi:neprilysin [Petromyzon marinus]|uniref:Neprilysin n=1 Tax=Petromyzon marinus TaxID=7757 RepID=A0AAJ7TWW9_PETMA|nr:neprilysin-like [Petromyzon marinus]XP_032824116.1 neprilysin-like [Petromyzon marinus]XP_032824117.1 neprilysin-like [Petromyzon marinus]